MSALWTSTAGESGILRKHDQRDKLEDLLVFGYACKLFRDDEKAKEIDQGKHLIPWMGENSLKIDRYDCRGALADLSLYEASKEGYDAMRWLGLSESERHLEQLCDEERYYSLHINEEEEELYKEEEKKRSQSRGQVQYSYDVPQEPQEGPTLPPEDDDEPYTPRPELDIPVNITLPTTVKQNARIEKTALFISKEGPQMEILLKTKQANNPQFAFMNQEEPLYRYYRHVLMAIKTGRYKIHTEPTKAELEEEKKQEEDHYLHPSLGPVTTTTVDSISTPPINQVFYKPSANCAYSQLVNRIQGTQPVPETVNPTPEATNGVQQMYNQQAYMQYHPKYGYYPIYDAASYYAAYGQNAAATYEQYKAYYEKNNTTNPYAQIVSNVKAKETSETTPSVENGTVQTEVFNPANTEITKAPVLYSQQPENPDPPDKPVKVKKTHLFSLAQYSGSESDSEDDNDTESDAHAVVIPPADTQIIVDKMASYVAKNGIDFENIVKSKGDPRFVFLDPSHSFYPYYKYKLKEFGGDTEKKEEKKVEEKKEEEIVDEEVPKPEVKTEKKIVKSKDKKIITPVCFSIKKSKDDSVTRDKSALPVEDSTDEEEQNNKEEETSNASQTEENSQPPSEKTEESAENSSASQVIEIEDPIMELIDLTDEMEDKRDAKRAEDRLKGKLALAAREKLAAKNKALQLERKKRAAAFLSQLKPTSKSKTEDTEETKISHPSSPPEEGEINGDTPPLHSMPDDLLRVYHIEPISPKQAEKNRRSRSPRHKSSHNRRKTRKRSHSHSRKKKRDRRSHERKKSKRKRRSRSHSRSRSRHRNKEHDSKTNKEKSAEKSYSSSSSESEDAG